MRLIPLDAYELALDSNGKSVELIIGNVAEAAAAARLADPAPGRDVEDDVIGWTFDLQRGVDNDETELTLPMPPQFLDPSFALAADENLGLDVGATERFAALTAQVFSLLVIEGDLDVTEELDDLGNGVSSFGRGDDNAIDFENVSALDRLGRPVRIAASEGAVAMSPSTNAIENWIEGGESLADESDYLVAAQSLDASGALGAYIIESDFDQLGFSDPDLIRDLQDRVTITESFELVAIGMTNNDGIPGNAVTYVFGTEAEAAEAADGVEAAWTDAELLTMPGTAIDDLFELATITVDGRAVTVVGGPAAGRDTGALVALVFREELQFLHS